MTQSAFSEAFEFVFDQEGGYVNNPKDPGGETKYGISKRAYPNEDIKNLTVTRAKEIYKRDYWDKMQCETMYPAVAITVFDTGVNCGPGACARWIQKIAKVKQDGVIGPITLKAWNAIDPNDAVPMLLRERMFSNMEADNWESFKNGWPLRWFRAAMAAGISMAEDPRNG